MILFLFCFMGWGGRGYGNGDGGNANPAVPYMMNTVTQADMQNGFDHAAVVSNLNGINQSINNDFANAEVSRCNSQANILQTLNNNQSDTMQAMNANHNGLTAQLNNIAMNQQNCCCENRAAVADLKYTTANEANATRNTVDSALHDIITNQTASTQAVLDKLCQQEIDQKNDTISQLRAQLNEANRLASQSAQTGQLMADNAAQTQNLVNRINPNPVPAYIVSNPNGCNCGTNYGGCCA